MSTSSSSFNNNPSIVPPHHHRPQRSQPSDQTPFQSHLNHRPTRPPSFIPLKPPHKSHIEDHDYNSEKDQPPYSPPILDSTQPILYSHFNSKPGVRFGTNQLNHESKPNHSTIGQQGNSIMRRKKSLVRPDRAPVDPSHRLYNYRNHAAAMEADERGRIAQSKTGATAMDGSVALYHPQFDPSILPTDQSSITLQDDFLPNSNHLPLPSHQPGFMAALGRPTPHLGYTGLNSPPSQIDLQGLKRGKSLLARGPGEAEESGLAILKRGETLRRKANDKSKLFNHQRLTLSSMSKKPLSPWKVYCTLITCCFPNFLLSTCGIKTPDRARAWREKMGILFLIILLMGAVAFLTFGFTQTVCGKPPLRYHAGSIQSGMMIFHGQTYDFDHFQHIAAPGISAGSNPVYNEFNAGSMDGSFLFQRVNQHCLNLFAPAPNTGIPSDSSGKLGWYFPCNLFNQYGTSPINKTGYAQGQLCHTQSSARDGFSKLQSLGQVYYTWNDIKNSSRNLAVYDSIVLDLNLLNWLDRSQVVYPSVFDDLKQMNNSFSGKDITMQLLRSGGQELGGCLTDIIQVGYIDTNTLGCVASSVVLYASLIVIIGVVLIKWAMAVSFAWFFGWRLGSFGKETAEQRAQRAAEIENWSSDIYRPAPARYRPNAKNFGKRSLLPNTSRFTVVGKPTSGNNGITGAISNPGRPISNYVGEFNRKSMAFPNRMPITGLNIPSKLSPPSSTIGGGLRQSHSIASLHQFPNSQRSSLFVGKPGLMSSGRNGGGSSSLEGSSGLTQPSGCPFPLYNIVSQPPPDYEPFNFPLIHTICLVTAYSESVEGLRTTLDSLATTDYPNSHKFILVIADGMVKGSGNDMTTPEICLSMMKELLIPAEEVEAKSYVAIADGHKRHNMAKVYAGFYSYDDNTIEINKQQRVPMVLIAKTGNLDEQHESKPGNRGKRDSQVLLMSFLQKVMFDERMTEFDYEFFNSIWRITGISPDHYEICLMVDADTKVFPDAVSRMAACMVRDSEIMGLCGETKIANKSDSWVTMIQVFEYYISHHLQKSFESMFGGVTCLPGCFSMYRIKAPKGAEGYWVPILANPDIVEHYSENVVETLHSKNLLLLGEDRFLTTLMLKTFPKRKMMFCPQAVCKTIVPDTFRVLLSQRRRWINSTIHNLFELLFVRDLCGTFCFSMQFVIGMELVGTLVLPAAISFTAYIIILTIIPGTEKPIVSLILLAFILGLPGLLIVITSRRIAYVGWMIIYLFSLPIWNAILPTYAYFHMDDFTWGETRKIEGAKEKAHGDKEGEFDSSNIIMKRWTEFERERRWKIEQSNGSGTLGGDPNFRVGSPLPPPSRRYSLNSSSDNWSNGTLNEPFINRATLLQELSLPQPLARDEGLTSSQSRSSLFIPQVHHHRSIINHQLNHHLGHHQIIPTEDPDLITSCEGLITPVTRSASDSTHHHLFDSNLSDSKIGINPTINGGSNSSYGNHEFSHLFQNPHPDENRTTSTISRNHSEELKNLPSKGISLSDVGVVPDSDGQTRQIDRSKDKFNNNGSNGMNSRTNSNSGMVGRLDESLIRGLPKPPGFGSFLKK
ncbi:hypothetical protein O181_039971 [Austropuccinia psidii MF-1]|uniref:chitin synthase n=1 Tax=Austropuccinia psidii MF-1 TaxID=1389203 RepID=A0A9Q3DGX3_9BASI|nr:hypothetical protein [Austropuccinia psidii MF-1]